LVFVAVSAEIQTKEKHANSKENKTGKGALQEAGQQNKEDAGAQTKIGQKSALRGAEEAEGLVGKPLGRICLKGGVILLKTAEAQQDSQEGKPEQDAVTVNTALGKLQNQ
jgi:hypothetical protein